MMFTKAYYNENDPKAAAWLRQLIINGDIADGEVDDRSILDVEAGDLHGFTQHHFFAGIGVWSHSLRLAGWPDTRPVWTASLPCQPFSVAGNQKGKIDERHLLPHFQELFNEYRPDACFGEQVPAAIKHGWLDDLYDEMERENYAVGSVVLTAAGAGKAHIRQRLYWVAERRPPDTESNGNSRGLREVSGAHEEQQTRKEQRKDEAEQSINVSGNDGMADTIDKRPERRLPRRQDSERENISGHAGCDGSDSGLGNTKHNGHIAREEQGSNGEAIQNGETRENSPCESAGASASRVIPSEPVDWLYCRDNKYRPIKRGINPLVRTVKSSSKQMVDGTAKGVVYSSDSIITPDDSAEARAARLKGYGNAIVAPVAASFIKAFLEVNNGCK